MTLNITETQETFESFISKSFLSEETKLILANAQIVLTPFEELREKTPPVFPNGTEHLIRFFQERLPSNMVIDVAINTEEYQEFQFNNNYKRLGNFVVKQIAVPVFVSVFAAFVYDQFIKSDESEPQVVIIDKATGSVAGHISTLGNKEYLEPTHIKFSVSVVDSTGSKNISYEGPATEIDTVLKALKKYEQ